MSYVKLLKLNEKYIYYRGVLRALKYYFPPNLVTWLEMNQTKEDTSME